MNDSLMLKQIRWLTYAQFFYSFGYHILHPTLAIMLLRAPFNLSIVETGTVLVFFNLADRGFAIFCAPLVNYFGVRRGQTTGFIVAAIALISLPVFNNYSVTLITLFIAGLGFSLAGLSVRSALGNLPYEKFRLQGFSDINIGLHAGAALGCVLAFILPYRDQSWIIFMCAGALILIAASCVIYSAISNHITIEDKNSLKQLFAIWKQKKCKEYGLFTGLKYILLASIAFFLYFPFFDLTPVFFEKSIGLSPVLGWVFSLDAILVVLFQKFATSIFKKLESYWQDGGVAIGFALFGLGSFAFALYWHHWTSWIVVIFYAFAIMLIAPQIDYLISVRTPSHVHSYLYGLKITSGALVRSLATAAGMGFLQMGQTNGIKINGWWYLMGFTSLVVFAWLSLIRIKQMKTNVVKTELKLT